MCRAYKWRRAHTEMDGCEKRRNGCGVGAGVGVGVGVGVGAGLTVGEGPTQV